VMVDTAAPSAGTVSIAESAAGTYASTSTLYYRPAAGGGTFDVSVARPTPTRP
jgi:hypothetical protein